MTRSRELAELATAYDTGTPLGMRNKLINGGMDVWQRATSHSTSGYGSADRWFNGITGSANTMSRQEFTPGQTDVPGDPRFYMRNVVTSSAGAANYAYMYQRIEGVRTLAGRTATLSFSAKASAALSVGMTVTQVFGTGGSPSTSVVADGQKVALTTSWARYSVQIDVASIAGKTIGTNGDDCLQLEIWMDAGSNFNARTGSLGQQSGTFEFADIQLEAGSVATPFERRPYGTELQLAQRYFWKQSASFYQSGFLDGGTGDYPLIWVTHPTPMRANPTTVFESSGTFYYNNNTATASFSPSGGTASYSGNTVSGYARKDLISNGPGSSTSQRSGQWLALLSFSAEL